MTAADDRGNLALASPLTLLLDEEAHGDRQAQEILLLTYTCDLGFFETFSLGLAQACGARITLVADVAQATVDPRAARRAGRSYLPGLAAQRGAFHPKLALIAGEQRVTAAIGSGNATLAGWQANCELWTVLHGDTIAAPAAFSQLADWLRALPEQIRLTRGVPAALGRCADLLDQLIGSTETVTDQDTRLVSTAGARIVDQLPTGPVDELAVSAPFHDPDAATLAALLDRFRPRRLRLAYQPGLTVLDGAAVAGLLAGQQGELIVDAEKRYRHGKLIEWLVDGRRYALTGSPNLSTAALRSTLAEGGNCELGLITEISASLLPAGAAADAEQRAALAATGYVRSRTRPVGPLLLGASRVEDGIEVQLARPLSSAARVYLSPATTAPETWELIGELAAGADTGVLGVAAMGGSRLRLAVPDPDHAAAVADPWQAPLRYGNTVLVIDPARVLVRLVAAGSRAPTTTPEDLFDDPRLAERFYADLTTLRSDHQPAPSAVSAAAGPADPDTVQHQHSTPDSWERYLDRCAGRLGTPLLRFALAMPRLPGSDDSLTAVSWVEEVVSDAEPGLDTDTAETEPSTAAGQPPPPELPDLARLSEADRRRYRRWAERLVEAAPRLEALDRMLITRLVLWTVAAGAWPARDRDWVPLLARAVSLLGQHGAPEPVQPPMASLAAVALSVLHDATPRYERTEHRLAYEQAAELARTLLPAAQEAYIAEYTDLLTPAFGTAVSSTTVSTLVADLIEHDPVADAVWALAALGRDAHRDGPRLLHVLVASGNPVLAAVQAVGAAQEGGQIAAWAGRPGSRWALCLWDAPDLYTIERAGTQTLWRHRRLPELISPRTLAVTRDLDAGRLVPHGPLINPIPAAQQLMRLFGIADPAPPADCG